MAKRKAKTDTKSVSEKTRSKKPVAQQSTEKPHSEPNQGSLSRFFGFFIPGVGFGGAFLLISALMLGVLFWVNKTYFLSDNSEPWQVEYNLPEGVWSGENVLEFVKKNNPELFERPYNDPTLLEDVANSFNLSQIVKKVNSVQRKYPHTIVLDIEYFKPVAMVYVNLANGYYPVDKNGYRLPTNYFKGFNIQDYLTIKGIKSSPMNPVGQRWNDAWVEVASKIADELLPYKDELEIIGIHVHDGVENGSKSAYTPVCFDVYLKNHTLIRWSVYIFKSSEAQLVDKELSTEEKIAILRQRLKEKGEIKPDSSDEMLRFIPKSKSKSE